MFETADAKLLLQDNLGLVDEFAFFIAPKLMGADGLPNFGKTGGLIGNVTNLRFTSVETIGEDVLIRAVTRQNDF